MKKLNKVRILHSCAILMVILLILVTPVLARDWSGKVIDAVTGEPIGGVKVEFGTQGRKVGTSLTESLGYFAVS